jgi:hypothetical protein
VINDMDRVKLEWRLFCVIPNHQCPIWYDAFSYKPYVYLKPNTFLSSCLHVVKW